MVMGTDDSAARTPAAPVDGTGGVQIQGAHVPGNGSVSVANERVDHGGAGSGGSVASQGGAPTQPRAARSWFSRFGSDLAYVLPGFPISTLAFMLLVTLFSVSVSTLIIWVGALLLPLTLFIGSGFAELSRRRVIAWGAPLTPVYYRPRGAGIAGLWRWVADPRRWVDLVFETIIAFPLRVVTFSIALTWLAMALGGVTWWAWAFYLPSHGDNSNWPGDVLLAITNGAVPESFARSYLVESLVYGAIGIIALVTSPFVLRWLALLDATITVAALGGNGAPAPGFAGSDPHRPLPGHGEPFAAGGWAPGEQGSQTLSGTAAASQRPAGIAGARASLPSAEAWGWIASGFAAVTAVAVGWPVLAASYGVHVALAMLVIVAQAVALVLIMRFMLSAIALATVSAAAATLLTVPSDGPWPWPVTMLIVQAMLVLFVALRAAWPFALGAWLLPQLGVVIAATVIAPGHGGENLITCGAVTAAIAVLGAFIRTWSRNRGALRAAQAETAALDERQQKLAERNRVARELHDVVAHSMSVIGVQATTAKYRLDGVSDEAAEEFESIAASSRVALGEMRGLLATLRDGEGSALTPQPGIADVPELVAATQRVGATISYTNEAATEVPPALGLTAYRIVQEGLSNALRHAPGADIEVRLREEGALAGHGALVIEVVNGPVPQGTEPQQAPGSGAGLAGVKDRATALGGSMTAEQTAAGGFMLRAILPMPAAE